MMERYPGIIYCKYPKPILMADPSIPFQYYLDQIGSPILNMSRPHLEYPRHAFRPYRSTLPAFPSPASRSVSVLATASILAARSKMIKVDITEQYNEIVAEKKKSKSKWRLDVRKYKCDLCHLSFSRSNTLVTHRRIHTGEKPFQCDKCGRHFRQHGNLTRHKVTHTSIKPFACHVCHRAFNRRSNLKTHSKIHRQQT